MNSKNLNDEILCIKAHNYNVGQHQRFHYTNAFLLPSDNQLLNQIANPKPKKDETDVHIPLQSEPGKQSEKTTKTKKPKKPKKKIIPARDTTTTPKKRGRPEGSKDKTPRIRSESGKDKTPLTRGESGVVTPHDAQLPTSKDIRKKNKNLRRKGHKQGKEDL
jgi:hypothetical protein